MEFLKPAQVNDLILIPFQGNVIKLSLKEQRTYHASEQNMHAFLQKLMALSQLQFTGPDAHWKPEQHSN